MPALPEIFPHVPTYAKRRTKLSRVLEKRALKSFHPRLFNVRFFAGESWSDKNADDGGIVWYTQIRRLNRKQAFPFVYMTNAITFNIYHSQFSV